MSLLKTLAIIPEAPQRRKYIFTKDQSVNQLITKEFVEQPLALYGLLIIGGKNLPSGFPSKPTVLLVIL